ncbi:MULTISPECIES: type II toxin-antitoxin system VapC family toxin [unclassified Frankia]|uniref:type II toxin-antitoxin system VapC family toxin n=1 Tax=unclassified Frankia TaxID=2632575 RepID=UPI001EF4E521|nr:MULTISPECIES: twitching motility protein PilT [unclassified Frankia]
MNLLYDAGALVAGERDDERMWARHIKALAGGITPAVPAPVIWQVWRDGARQARLARLLRGCLVEPVDHMTARAVGELLGRSRTSDGVDAIVALSAARHGGVVYTSDPGDLQHLAGHLPNARPFTIVKV